MWFFVLLEFSRGASSPVIWSATVVAPLVTLLLAPAIARLSFESAVVFLAIAFLPEYQPHTGNFTGPSSFREATRQGLPFATGA